MLGQPAGEARVIAIAAWQAAYEPFDYATASAIAIIMAAIEVLVLARSYASSSAGFRASQLIDAMAVISMLTTTVPLVLALRFINPTQIVSRTREERVATVMTRPAGPSTRFAVGQAGRGWEEPLAAPDQHGSHSTTRPLA